MNYWKLIFAILLTLYYISYASSDPAYVNANWNIVDNVDLVIHEGGHIVFIFFGQFMHVLGGSLMQVLLPAIFSGYFFLRREYYSGSILLFWVAQNILNVATYMGDSIIQQLPLLGGDGVIHDWNYLLTHMGVLGYTDALSSIMRDFGFLTIVCAAALSIYFSFGLSVRMRIFSTHA